jgi:hypothetical protein
VDVKDDVSRRVFPFALLGPNLEQVVDHGRVL